MNSERGGILHTVELLPNGHMIPVTKENYIHYMHLFAHYKLNVETNQQSRAFLDGCRDIVPVDWIRMFGPHELQLLIGGDDLNRIDVEDLRTHCKYGGGYHESQPFIQVCLLLYCTYCTLLLALYELIFAPLSSHSGTS